MEALFDPSYAIHGAEDPPEGQQFSRRREDTKARSKRICSRMQRRACLVRQGGTFLGSTSIGGPEVCNMELLAKGSAKGRVA
jgi:hypothetical protein